MKLDKFSEPDSVTGYVTKPYLQKEQGGSKYFDMRVPLSNVEIMELENGDLLEILVINEDGEQEFFKRKVSKVTGKGLKFYVPRSVVKSLNMDEDSLLEVFVSKD